MPPRDEATLRAELIKACRILYKLGIVELIGHLSARIDEECALIKPRSVPWRTARPQDLVVMRIEDGRRLDGSSDRPVVVEWPLHTEMYKTRPDVNAVLHCHPYDSVLMAALDIKVEPINRDAMLFPGGVPVWDDRECIVDRMTMVDRQDFGQDVARTMGDGTAVILKHHGVVVAGRSIGNVVLTAHYLERTARAHITAASVKLQPFMDPALVRDIEVLWKRDEPGYGLVAPHSLIADEEWEMMKQYHLDAATAVQGGTTDA